MGFAVNYIVFGLRRRHTGVLFSSVLVASFPPVVFVYLLFKYLSLGDYEGALLPHSFI